MLAAVLAAAPARAAESVDFSLGGYYQSVFGYVDEDVHRPQHGVTQHYAELAGSAETVLESGLVLGLRAAWEALYFDSHRNREDIGDDLDRYSAYVEGAFGRLSVGAQYSPPFLMHVTAPYFVDSHGVDCPNFQHVTTSAGIRTGTQLLLSENAAKVAYFTPRLFGLQLGASYAPDNDFTQGVKSTCGYDDEPEDGELEDVYEIGANYVGIFADTEVAFSVAYATADPDRPLAGAADPEEWNIGGEIGRNGFTAGAAYYRGYDISGFRLPHPGNDVEGVAAGLQYGAERWTIGAGVSVFDDDARGDLKTYELGGQFTIARDVALSTDFLLYRLDERAGQALNNDSFAIIFGFDVSF